MSRTLTRLLILGIICSIITSFVFSQDPVNKSNQLSFGNKSLNFLVLSDWGREGSKDKAKDKKAAGQVKVAQQLAATAEEVKASFVVTCGDNFHGKGVSSVTDSLWQENFENVYTAKSLMIPWYIALGNHDYEGNADAELEYAKTSKRWIEPARYYSFTKKLSGSTQVLFVILDSSPFVEEYINQKDDGHHLSGQKIAVQWQWCDSVLSISTATWKFVFFHHPAYSASSTHGSTVEIQRTFVPLFEKYHVNACFSGHDHDLQHSRPDSATVEYFGCGGGSETRPAGQAAFTKYSNASLGFGVVSISQRTMRFSFVDDKGEQIYHYEIYRSESSLATVHKTHDSRK
ncbi:MAG: metallophosphoesterase [Bacteroidota bacterium]